MARTRNDSAPGPDEDSVGAATRALAEATATLTRLLSHQVSSVGAEVSEAVATSLREAARGLADASESVEKKTGGSRAHERRQARVDRTRADLLAAAARVFAAQGYEGAAVGDIASAAGYTKGAVYANFGSKSDLFLALAREQVFCTAPASGEPGKLRDELVAGLSQTPDDPAMLLVLEVLAYAARHPESRSELGPLLSANLHALAVRVHADRLDLEGRSPEPDEPPAPQDLDTAIGLVAVANFSAMLTALVDGPEALSTGRRLVDRMLDR